MSRILRRALVLDAIASGAMGVLLIAGAALLDGPLGLPTALLLIAGIALVPFAAFVGRLGTRATAPRGAVLTVVAVNAAWTLASLGALFLTDPTMLGVVFVLAQALTVAVFAELQVTGLRRGARAAAPHAVAA